MKFTAYYTTDYKKKNKEEVEFNTLEELAEWVKKVNVDEEGKNLDGVIIKPPLKKKDGTYCGEWELEIYDSWRE